MGPERLAVVIEREDAEIAEIGVDAIGVDERRLRCVAVFEMK